MSDEKTPAAPTTPPPPAPDAPDPNEGPGKGKAFFDRAKTVASTGNYDYAIEMFIQGLNKEPFNIEEHKALREVAMRRKISGGKSGGGLLGLGGVKMPFKGKNPKEGLLNNEFTLARDVGNISAMLAMVRNADILKLKEVVLWMGLILKEANRTSKSPKLDLYTELADIFAHHEEFARACECINSAMEIRPNDMDLAARANTYAAQETIRRGKYVAGGSFKDSIKDVEATKERLQEENLAKSSEHRATAMARAKAEYEANPKELQVIAKYAKSLQDIEEEEYENEAIKVYEKGFADTKIYRLKMGMGDVRIKQFKRNLRILQEAIKADPKDQDLIAHFEQLNKERLDFELGEFRERADFMPTDLLIKYELGLRHWQAKQYDETITALQEAQNSPKVRVDAMLLLGRSFLIQGMKPEAIDTLKKAIDAYDLASTGDTKAKSLYYYYARALEENKKLKEASEIYSKVVQWDVSFLDARKRMVDLREKLEGQS